MTDPAALPDPSDVAPDDTATSTFAGPYCEVHGCRGRWGWPEAEHDLCVKPPLGVAELIAALSDRDPNAIVVVRAGEVVTAVVGVEDGRGPAVRLVLGQ